MNDRNIILDRDIVKNFLIEHYPDGEEVPTGHNLEVLVDSFIEFLGGALFDWLEIQVKMYFEDDGIVEQD